MAISIYDRFNSLNPGNYLEFLSVDLTPFGGDYYRLVKSGNAEWGSTIQFLGSTWFSLPFKREGFELDGTGGSPNPTLSIPDFDGTLLGLCQQYQDMIGAAVKIYVSTEEFYQQDIYEGPFDWEINQLEEATGTVIRFNLANELNKGNKKIPNRILTPDEFPGLGRGRWK